MKLNFTTTYGIQPSHTDTSYHIRYYGVNIRTFDIRLYRYYLCPEIRYFLLNWLQDYFFQDHILVFDDPMTYYYFNIIKTDAFQIRNSESTKCQHLLTGSKKRYLKQCGKVTWGSLMCTKHHTIQMKYKINQLLIDAKFQSTELSLTDDFPFLIREINSTLFLVTKSILMNVWIAIVQFDSITKKWLPISREPNLLSQLKSQNLYIYYQYINANVIKDLFN